MCGISGIVDLLPPDERLETVKRMLSLIRHRGPDESGIYHTEKVSLGNVRLSIIDLKGGQQPLCDVTGRYWITFNGEIFNYRELRQELIQSGHPLKSSSDTEVLVQLFALYGAGCLDMLNGQFAFAIWDNHKEELFLARDRVGIRPLFYSEIYGGLLFASEVKGLFAYSDLPRRFSERGLRQVFTFWSAVTPNTVFDGVFEIPAGHYATFKGGKLNIQRYWQLNFSLGNKPIELTSAKSKLDELLKDSVQLRLRADVEVAAYLSGGLDSSATVNYIRSIAPDKLNTFSIGFKDTSFDETSYQELAVRWFRTSHRSVFCDTKAIHDVFPDVTWHAETPLTRTAPAPMYILARLVRESGIKVVITGEGADEFLAGYNIFKESQVRHFWASDPTSKLRPLLLKRLYPYVPAIQQANVNVLKMFFGFRLEDTEDPFYSHFLRWNNSRQVSKYLSHPLPLNDREYDPVNDARQLLPGEFQKYDTLQKAQWIESTLFMTGYLLSSQGDRMSMANSVEGRYPFLDHRLIEYLSGVPSGMKLKGLNEKYLLKSLMKGILPDQILNRSKQPYRAPVSEALVMEENHGWFKEVTDPHYIEKAGIFSAAAVSTLIRKSAQHLPLSESEHMALALITSTQLLFWQFVDNFNQHIPVGETPNLRIINTCIS